MSEKEDKEQTEEQEINLYKKFVSRSKELFEAARDKTAATYNKSMESAKEEMIEAGKFSREQGEKLKNYLQRDLLNTPESVKKISNTVKETLEPKRVSSGVQSALSNIFSALGNAFTEWSSKIESNLTYKTGELTSPGTLVCKECEGTMRFKKTGRIPPCPKCSKTEFKKTY